MSVCSRHYDIESELGRGPSQTDRRGYEREFGSARLVGGGEGGGKDENEGRGRRRERKEKTGRTRMRRIAIIE